MKTIKCRLKLAGSMKTLVHSERDNCYFGQFLSEEIAAEFVETHNAQYDAEQAAKAQPTGIPADPHAEIKAEYAKLALIYEKPWELVQIKDETVPWRQCNFRPEWAKSFQYRIRPAQDIMVNNVTVPEPVRHRLREGTQYWIAAPIETNWHAWFDTKTDNLWLERGLIHLVPETAAKHGEAMVAPSRIDRKSANFATEEDAKRAMAFIKTAKSLNL